MHYFRGVAAVQHLLFCRDASFTELQHLCLFTTNQTSTINHGFNQENSGMSSYHDAIRNWWKSSQESRSTKNSCRKIRDNKQTSADARRTILFPNFAQCKTNKQFPICFSACLNSGDVISLRALLETRTTRNCTVDMLGKELEIKDYIRAMELCEELYPDCVTSIPQVTSIGNKICAIVFLQYTASKIIDRGIQESYSGEYFNSLFSLCHILHTDPRRLSNFINAQPVDDRPSLLAKVFSADELIVRGQGTMKLTISEKSGKIKRIEIIFDSAEYEGVCSRMFSGVV